MKYNEIDVISFNKKIKIKSISSIIKNERFLYILISFGYINMTVEHTTQQPMVNQCYYLIQI